MSKIKKILVTGSSGQLGKELHKIAINYPEYEFHFLTRTECDITSRIQISAVLNKINPDYLVNAAAYTQVDKAEEEKDTCFGINAYALQNLISESGQAKIIHISSDYVYDSLENIPLKEDSPCSPKSIYAKSKLLGDHFLQNGSTPYIILRTSWVYSQYGSNFVKTMIRLSDQKDELSIINDQIGAPTYAQDLAETIMVFITNDEDIYYKELQWNQIYNYCNSGKISWFDFAKEIFKYTSKAPSLLPIPSYLYPTPAARPKWSVLNLEKIKSINGIEIRDWKESLQKCLQNLVN